MRKTGIFIFILFMTAFSFGQNSSFQLHTLSDSASAVLLDTLWKYHDGDNPEWARTEFNDSAWRTENTRLEASEIPVIDFSGIGWFRLHLAVEKGMAHHPLALILSESGASDVYLDGKLLHSYGHPDKDGKKEIKYSQTVPFIFEFGDSAEHVLAVRFSNHFKETSSTNGFTISLSDSNISIVTTDAQNRAVNIFTSVLSTFFLTLAFIHFLLYVFYRKQRTNLFYSIFVFLFGLFFFIPLIIVNVKDPSEQESLSRFLLFIAPFFCTSLLGFIYSLFHPSFPKKFWIFFVSLLTLSALDLLNIDVGLIFFVYICTVTITSFIEVFIAIYRKKKGAWVVGTAVLSFLLLILALLTKNALGFGSGIYINHFDIKGMFLILFLLMILLSIPVSMSVYLARQFAGTNKDLSNKLDEVETLSQRTIEQEKEKQKILETQKEVLEIQVEQRTHEISEQKKMIEEKNKDITDSINYAKRIQDAILPPKELKYRIFPEAFVLFKPKDIVSGDFYWFAEKDNKRLIASCDCTGHGVPGALMSMVGNNILNQIVNENGITSPELVLNLLHQEIRKALKQDGEEAAKDGMDIALLCFNSETEVEYAGAQRPLWHIRSGELTEIKADKQSIGGLQDEKEKFFTKHSVSLQKDDALYIFSDGFVDQFGGSHGKKFMSKQFRNLLLSITHKPMAEQEKLLDTAIESWRGQREQIDDILVIGISA